MNTETGEISEDTLECQSYTDPEVFYKVRVERDGGQLLVLECSCPAYMNSGRPCKHIMAVQRAGGPTE